MREHLAVADVREVIVHYEAETLPCRLILPHGSRRWFLDVATADEGAGRPWILRWSRYARGKRHGDEVISHERLQAPAPLCAAMLQAMRAALHFIEHGQRVGHA